MSLHAADYEKFAFNLMGWFAQAVSGGLSSSDALKTVAVAALGAAVNELAPSAVIAPTPPSVAVAAAAPSAELTHATSTASSP